MSDIPEWEKQFWAKKAQQAQDLPHYEPAHVTQQRMRPQQPVVSPHMRMDKEIDLTAHLQQKMMQQGMSMPTPGGQRVCYLKEGVQAYRNVSQGFGSTVPLVLNIGPTYKVQGKQFERLGTVRCYVVEGNETVDLSKINEHPERMRTLVQVKAPWIGEILVPESAIVNISSGGSHGGRALLND